MKKRSWSIEQLTSAVKSSRSYRQVILQLGLVPAGGNYAQLERYIKENNLDTSHFVGQGWNVGLKFKPFHKIPLNEILKNGSTFQSYKLKKRLFDEGLKKERCEDCGWAKESSDGRIPLEINHINGNPRDNRMENLEILCPNCHSLKPNYRGRNKKKGPSGEMVYAQA